jgi:outer membrane protein with beta-barrel domain
MFTKFSVIVMALFVVSSAYGQVEREQFKPVKKGKQMDLITEGSTLRLSQEGSVQEYIPPSNMFIAVLGGGFQPTALSVEAHGNTINYDFNHLLPLASIQFTHLPWHKNGQWGWSGSLGYSYSQYQDATTTALHILPLELNAVYRMELSDTQKVVPYLMVGPQAWTFFQRGIDQDTTSQTSLSGSATAGVAFSLNRFHITTGRNDTEIVLQYQRTFGSSTSSNFDGNTIQLGGTLAL